MLSSLLRAFSLISLGASFRFVGNEALVVVDEGLPVHFAGLRPQNESEKLLRETIAEIEKAEKGEGLGAAKLALAKDELAIMEKAIPAWRAIYGLRLFPDGDEVIAGLPIRGRLAKFEPTVWAFACSDGLVREGVSPSGDREPALSAKLARDGGISLPAQNRPNSHGLWNPNGALPVPELASSAHSRNGGVGSRVERLARLLIEDELALFRSFLDADALAIMRSGAITTKRKGAAAVAAYNVLAGAYSETIGAAEGDGANAAVKRIASLRREAIRILPALGGAMLRDAGALAGIDAGTPLHRTISERLGISVAVLRAITRRADGSDPLAAQTPSAPNLRSGIVRTLRVASVIPPDAIPENVDEWNRLRPFCQAIDALGLAPTAPGGDATSSGARRALLAELISRHDGSFLLDASQPFIARLPHVRDMARNFADEILLPVLRSENVLPDAWTLTDSAPAAALVLLSGRSPNAFGKLSGEHMARVAALGGRTNAGIAEIAAQARWAAAAWPPIHGTFIDPENGNMAIPLLRQIELDDEGRAMRHCVASYGYSCAKGTSHIFSIRADEEGESDALGGRLSTLELIINPERRSRIVKIRQHKAFMNGPVSKSAEATARRLVERLNSDSLDEENAGNLARALAVSERNSIVERRIPVDPDLLLAARCGFDHRSEEARRAAWDRWSRLLGGKARKTDAVGFLLALPNQLADVDPDDPLLIAIATLKRQRADDRKESPT
jgi:hypothetical protein